MHDVVCIMHNVVCSFKGFNVIVEYVFLMFVYTIHCLVHLCGNNDSAEQLLNFFLHVKRIGITLW